MKGEPEPVETYYGEKFNLSLGIVETDISETEFQEIAGDARVAFNALKRMRQNAMRLSKTLEKKLGLEVFSR